MHPISEVSIKKDKRTSFFEFRVLPVPLGCFFMEEEVRSKAHETLFSGMILGGMDE